MSAKRKPSNSRSQYHSSYSPLLERPLLILESYYATRTGDMPVALGNFGEMQLSKEQRQTAVDEESARRCHAVLRALLFFEAELQRR